MCGTKRIDSVGRQKTVQGQLQGGEECLCIASTLTFSFFICQNETQTLASQSFCEVLMREWTALENNNHTKSQEIESLKSPVHVLKILCLPGHRGQQLLSPNA